MHKTVDLHMHTCFSDGFLRPAQVVRGVIEHGGISHFGITDHDSLSGIEPALRELALHAGGDAPPVFLPGVELSTRHRKLGLSIHVLGYFPRFDFANPAKSLEPVEAVIGPYCQRRCQGRFEYDVVPRVEHLFALNLEGVQERYHSPDEFLQRFKELARQDHDHIWQASQKQNDVIQHPLPTTYLDLINLWEELMPSSSKERFCMYILRPDSKRKERLAALIAAQEEIPAKQAMDKAAELQGSLCRVSAPSDMLTPSEGVELLKEAGAISVLAHPAVDHAKLSYEQFDREVLQPMLQKGLDGLEIYYPYDPQYRDEAQEHYAALARRHNLLTSGGSDFHGDGRTEMAELGTRPEDVSILKAMV
jgi:predicted metal-dependent phosphoesterase TrpH